MWHITLLFLLFISIQHSFEVSIINNRLKRQESSCTTPNGDRGICLPIKKCKALLDVLVKGRTDPQIKEFVTRSRCGKETYPPNVCCKLNGTVIGRNSSPPNHFPTKCGNSSVFGNRIADGRPAALRAWPWMAILGYTTGLDNDNVDWLCGGVLVTNQHVVTAAHCIDSKLIIVRLGEHDLSRTNEGANPVDIPVDKLTPHERYDAIRFLQDIGIVRLKNAVTFSPDIQPICLPFSTELRSDFVGHSPYIAGWGTVKWEGGRSTILLEAQVEIKSIESCQSAYYALPNNEATIDQSVICAGGETKDSCQGDSGGPLMIPQQDGLFYLLGIVSYGHKCAERGFPGIYTKVADYLDWISHNTAD